MATCEVSWSLKLLIDMHQSMDGPIVIFSDNISNIHLENNPVYDATMKHIEVHHHFVREKALAGEIDLVSVGIEDQVADIFTQALGLDKL